MKNKRRTTTSLFLTLLFAIVCLCVSCVRNDYTNEKTNVPNPTIVAPTLTVEFNKELVIIEFPGSPKPYKNGTMINFLIKNQGDETFVFPNNFGVKILQKENGDWKAVENNINDPEKEHILKPSKMNATGLILVAVPFIQDLKVSNVIRIEIMGHEEKSPDRLVGAYINIDLEP